MADGDNQYKKTKGFKWTKGDEDVPALALVVDDTSKILHICEPADVITDWALAACSHPTVCVHSATNPATEYIKMYHDATNAYIDAVGATTLQLLVAGTAEVSIAAASVSPTTTDGAALGTTALMWSDLFLASGGVINFNNGDVTLTHATNALALVGGCLNLHTSGAAYAFTAGTPAFAMYTTNASVHASTSAESFLVYNTQTGIAGVGGRARFYMTTNVALGGWSNALKAAVAYGASGRTTGLGSALCAELEMSAGTSSGTYAPLESEIVLAANAVCGTSTSFLFMSANGADVATWRTNGDLFYIQGMGTASSTANVFHTTGTVSATHGLRINIDGVDYDILLKASTYA